MKFIFFSTLLSLATLSLSTNCNQPYGQCNGSNWNSVTCCPNGFTCQKINKYWSQCLPSNVNSSSKTKYRLKSIKYNSNKISTNTFSNNKYINNKFTKINKSTNNKFSKTKSHNKSTNNKYSKTKSLNKSYTKKPKNNKFEFNPNTKKPINNNPSNEEILDSTNKSSNESVINDSNSLGRISCLGNAIGYGSMNGGVTGGKNGKIYVINNQIELDKYSMNIEPKIFLINGIIKLDKDIIIGSNTSIIGYNGKNNGFTGGGLSIKKSKNIIIQNLSFSNCLGRNHDCINAQKSTNIWIDHCEFYNDRNHGKDYYDGLIDFTHASDYITVSWNNIHDHYKASLVGHSDNNGVEDTDKLHITYHHNYFNNIGSRLPSIRFGTAHIYNNVYENIDISCINIRMGAKALVENNIFIKSSRPISTNLDSKEEGAVVQRNNDFGINADTNSITNTNGLTTVPYSYIPDEIDNLSIKVQKFAGPFDCSKMVF